MTIDFVVALGKRFDIPWTTKRLGASLGPCKVVERAGVSSYLFRFTCLVSVNQRAPSTFI
jgi:hypothetical protein